MERKNASDYPQELLNLFDKYVHGEIERRDFLEGAKKFAVGGMTATMIWESLRPNYAWAQQVPKDDPGLTTDRVTVDRRRATAKSRATSSSRRRRLANCRACWWSTRTAV